MRGKGRILRDRVLRLGSLLSRLLLLLRERRPRRRLVDLDLLHRPVRRPTLREMDLCEEVKGLESLKCQCFVLGWIGGCECM